MLLHEFVTPGPNLRVFLSHCGVGAWPYHLHPCQLSRKRPKFPSGDKLGFGLRLLSWIRQRD